MGRLFLLITAIAMRAMAQGDLICIEGPPDMRMVQFSKLPPGAQLFKVSGLAGQNVRKPDDLAVSLSKEVQDNLIGVTLEIYSGVGKLMYAAKSEKPCSKEFQWPVFVFAPRAVAAAGKAWSQDNVIVIIPSYKDQKRTAPIAIKNRFGGRRG